MTLKKNSTRITAPSAMRYQPKGLKSCLRIKPMNSRITSTETRNATIIPVRRISS